MAGFARRDENSSVGTKITWAGPSGAGRRPTLNARSGRFEGKTRGVGRKETRDANSSPRVIHVQPRRLDGKFASPATVLEVVKPNGGRKDQNRRSQLERYGKTVSKGLTTPERTQHFGDSAKVGRKLVDVEKAYGRGPAYAAARQMELANVGGRAHSRVLRGEKISLPKASRQQESYALERRRKGLAGPRLDQSRRVLP